jgi:excisionase family DNA binding protein
MDLSHTERNKTMLRTTTQNKLAHSVEEVAAQTSLSKAFVRNEIRDGNLTAKKAGRRVLVLDTDLKTYLENLSGK